MGQKVSPHGFRVGVNKDWSSSWIADKKNFSKYLIEDANIRKFINKKHAQNSIATIEIERTSEHCHEKECKAEYKPNHGCCHHHHH